MNAVPTARFRLGRIVATTFARERLTDADILSGIQRHHSGDWGDVNENDRNENERSLIEGRRLLSAYHASSGVKFWIITETDRSFSTVLLPEEY